MHSADGDTAIVNESASSAPDSQSIVNLITESCRLRLKSAWNTFVEKYPAERLFMQSCGKKELEGIQVDISESELDRLINFDIDRRDTATHIATKTKPRVTTNAVKVTIKCYCFSKSHAAVTVYFRCSLKWTMFKSGKVHFDNPAKEFSTAWNDSNFQQHLKSHEKYRLHMRMFQ